MMDVESSSTPSIGENCNFIGFKEEVHLFRQPSDNQETPGSVTLGSKPSSDYVKLGQGRLLFPDCNDEENPVISVSEGCDQQQCIEEKMDLDVSLTPVKPSSATVQVTPNQTTPTQVTPILTTPDRVTPPSVNKSCSPKPKLSKAEREALRLEREKARAEAKLKREEEKRERQLKREQEAKERMEKKAREEQERKEKREKKEAERRARDEERKKKEEERMRAEIKKEQAREEKLRKEQENRKRFMGFFSRKPKEEIIKTPKVSQESSFLTPFSVKTDMTLTTSPRSPLTDTTDFDQLFLEQRFEASLKDWLNSSRGRSVDRGKAPSNIVEEDVVIEIKPADLGKKWHYKLIQFHTNYRPAYFGTWRKKSSILNPRNPFKKDEGILDYEVDSDDEWEEEDPGESISNSEGEDGDEGDEGEDSEEDDGFFVPHGYLSDGEGDNDDEAIPYDPSGAMDDSESKKKKMAAKEKAWEMEFARKCQPLKPVKIGCVWSRLAICEGGDGVRECDLSKDEEFLRQFAAVALVDLPLSLETKKDMKESESSTTGVGSESMKMPVPEEALPDLIRMMHGSAIGVTRLIKTFRTHWGSKKLQQSATSDQSESKPNSIHQSSPPLQIPKTPILTSPSQVENASGISKRQLEKKIHEIAVKEIRPPLHKPLWYVHEPILLKYHIDVLSLIPLVSPQTKTAPEKVKSTSPVTPSGSGLCGNNKKGAKRKIDSIPTVKSLFQNLNKWPENTTTCESPKPKRVKLELNVTSEPRAEKRPLESDDTQPAKRLCPDKELLPNCSVTLLDSTSSNCSEDSKENKCSNAIVDESKLKISLLSALLKDVTTNTVSK